MKMPKQQTNNTAQHTAQFQKKRSIWHCKQEKHSENANYICNLTNLSSLSVDCIQMNLQPGWHEAI